MDPEEYVVVIKGICAELQAIPDDTMMLNVTQFCRKRNLNYIRSQSESKDDFHQRLIQMYLNHISKADLIAEQNMLNEKALAMHKKPTKKVRHSAILGPLNQWVDRSMHVLIDSINRDISSDRGTQVSAFRFVLASRNDRALLNTGIVPSRLVPENITYLKIGSLRLPYSATLAALNSTQEITLTFTDLRNNGAIISNQMNNETVHFSFTYVRSTFDTNMVELTPTNKYCKFDPPLTYLDDVSIQWNDPQYPIQFDLDRMTPTLFNYATTDGRITFGSAHNLTTNDVIIVIGLTTLNDAANANILNLINNPRGIKITVISGTVVKTDIDFTTIVSPDTSALPLVIFKSKCFRVPLEIGYQDVDSTA